MSPSAYWPTDCPIRCGELRKQWGIVPVYKMVDTCAAEFDAETPYFYSTYEQENEATPIPEKKAIVIGSGPIRIGQGIEFDYCCVHSAWALQEMGIRSIIVNSNPETVFTDFDTSDRLYFESLDEESMRNILENEGSEHRPVYRSVRRSDRHQHGLASVPQQPAVLRLGRGGHRPRRGPEEVRGLP